MYEFWYNYVKPKQHENVKLWYMDTGNFIVHVKTDNSYKYISENDETKFDTFDKFDKVWNSQAIV